MTARTHANEPAVQQIGNDQARFVIIAGYSGDDANEILKGHQVLFHTIFHIATYLSSQTHEVVVSFQNTSDDFHLRAMAAAARNQALSTSVPESSSRRAVNPWLMSWINATSDPTRQARQMMNSAQISHALSACTTAVTNSTMIRMAANRALVDASAIARRIWRGQWFAPGGWSS